MIRENHLVAESHFFISCTRDMKNSIRNLIEFRGYDDITLDFSTVSDCFPDAILPIIADIVKYRDDGVKFTISPPQKIGLMRTFISSNWCHLVDPASYPEYRGSREGHLPARRFTDATSQNTVVNEVMDHVLRVATFLERNDLKALERAINDGY